MTTMLPFRRGGHDDEEPLDAEVVAVEQDDDEDDFTPSRAREAVARLASRPLPTRQQMVARTKWWSVQGLVASLKSVMLLPGLLGALFKAIGFICGNWARLVECKDLAEAVKSAEGNERSKAQERLARRRRARWIGSGIVLAAVCGSGAWLYCYSQLSFWLTVAGLAVLLTIVGRKLQPPEERTEIRIATQPPWDNPAVSLQRLTVSVIEALEECHGEETVAAAGRMNDDPLRMERRLRVKSKFEIKPDDVKAVERALGCPNGAIRNLATESASIRELVMRYGDPLTIVAKPSDLDSGSRTIAEPQDIGVSSSDVPFALTFAGVHVAVVGATGSGKTKGALWAIVDRLSVCRDAVIWGVDLTNGPAFPMWQGVVQRRAINPETADEMLADVKVEIDRRMQVLTDIAEDDDPDNDTDEWHPGLGPGLVVVFDEFAQLAEYKGGKGPDGKPRPDLLGKVEYIARLGRKVWVSAVLGTQKAGNSDFGSQTIVSQIGAKIILACAERDTTALLSTDHRDAGWRPDLLAPSVEGDARDAGKCYVESVAHRDPDIYRTYRPLSGREVKERGIRRVAEGLPTLTGRPVAQEEAIDVLEVPGLLAAIERVFNNADRIEWMATVELQAALREDGLPATAPEIGKALQLAPGVKPGTRRGQTWGYELAAVMAKIASLG